MEFDYEAKVRFAPSSAKRGERVRLEVEYAEAGGGAAPERAVVRIQGYGLYEPMHRDGDRTFSWSYTIPWEAPVKTYELEILAFDAAGEKRAHTKTQYQITG